MVERINKISGPDHIRVDESKDATEDDGRKDQGGEEEGEGAPPRGDAFDHLRDKTDWKILSEKARSQQKRIEVAIDDVAEMKFLHINLKTNPSLLNLKVRLKDGTSYPSAYFSIARHVALPFQHYQVNARIEAVDLTEANTVTFFVPDVRTDFRDEETRVTHVAEKTFSQTVKMLVRKTLLQKIGVQDSETRHANPEIVWAYVTAGVVIAAFLFAVWWLMR